MKLETLTPDTKLPLSGTTIFTQMSALAAEHQAINLSQGFPDFDGPDYLRERLSCHVAQGHNQYAPMAGVKILRDAIAEKTQACYGVLPDPDSEITVTAGATEALFAAIAALVRPGDEVICFDPSYDSYGPAVTLAGGVVRRVTLSPPLFRPDWSGFRAALSDKTRLVIVNTPHNPSASVWRAADFETLWQAIGSREIYVLSDEVYEHINFSEQGHASALAHPGLRGRAVVVSSFGKTYHMTGWKVGYCVAPAPITAELRKVHQYLTFAVNTPAQMALADMVRYKPEHHQHLPDFYRHARERFAQGLADSRFRVLPGEGTYFLLADYSAISSLDDVAFCRWLTVEHGVAAIPLSVFCAGPWPHRLIRFCFAKRDATLDRAAARLRAL